MLVADSIESSCNSTEGQVWAYYDITDLSYARSHESAADHSNCSDSAGEDGAGAKYGTQGHNNCIEGHDYFLSLINFLFT